MIQACSNRIPKRNNERERGDTLTAVASESDFQQGGLSSELEPGCGAMAVFLSWRRHAWHSARTDSSFTKADSKVSRHVADADFHRAKMNSTSITQATTSSHGDGQVSSTGVTALM
jgi:hypothetical protein